MMDVKPKEKEFIVDGEEMAKIDPAIIIVVIWGAIASVLLWLLARVIRNYLYKRKKRKKQKTPLRPK